MKLTKIVWLSLLTLSTTLNAAGYYRCTDPNGNVVFSQTSCGEKAEKQIIEETGSDHTSKGKGKNVFDQLNSMKKIGADSKKKKSTASKEKDPCAGIRALTLRNARVGGDIMKCHTKSDVLSMFGEPTSTSTWSTGGGRDDVRWYYSFKDTSSLSVNFLNGKVTSWRKWDWDKHKDY